MPDPVTHYTFGKQLFSRLPANLQEQIDFSIYERALQGPDPWSTLGFWGGRAKAYAVRSSVMHQQKTGPFLQELMNEAKDADAKEVFSLLAGFLCHYCLDKAAHPYIVCKGGFYDGTKETRHLRGGHVRMERSIDCYFIRRFYRKVPWRFSLAKNIFKHKRYPESLKKPINAACERVYGWKDSFDLFNRALRDERLFYRLMQDPFGFFHYLLRPLSHGTNNYSLYSYYRRDTDSSQLDYLNEAHHPWPHPYDPATVCTDSFFDLYNHAMEEALGMILDGYGMIFEGKEQKALPFQDWNYSTGLSCGDEKNGNPPICQPLIYKKKYINQ